MMHAQYPYPLVLGWNLYATVLGFCPECKLSENLDDQKKTSHHHCGVGGSHYREPLRLHVPVRVVMGCGRRTE